ncbi:MAG: hypothetical protein JWR21_275 [Herminiimonas sp.]|nr:hypothetical protein [Herminiimonas sp.]MDB5852622.1 hypothetical protein [Herminiimonas sp.]
MNSPTSERSPSGHGHRFRPSQAVQRWLLRGAAAAVLTLAFLAYLRPSFVFDLANRITLCF